MPPRKKSLTSVNTCIIIMSDNDADGVPQEMSVDELIIELQRHPKGSIVSVGGYSGYGALILESKDVSDATPQD